MFQLVNPAKVVSVAEEAGLENHSEVQVSPVSEACFFFLTGMVTLGTKTDVWEFLGPGRRMM